MRFKAYLDLLIDPVLLTRLRPPPMSCLLRLLKNEDNVEISRVCIKDSCHLDLDLKFPTLPEFLTEGTLPRLLDLKMSNEVHSCPAMRSRDYSYNKSFHLDPPLALS